VADDDLLQPDVAIYEPRVALLGGPDGLDVVRRLVTQAGERPEIKLVALEIGYRQADAVAALLVDAGFAEVERIPDLAEYERVIVGRR
jgi:release factor glutamine methyltransferase